MFKIIASVILVLATTGCAFNQHQTAGSGQAEFGVVVHAQTASVASENQSTGIAAIGGILGGAAGHMLAHKQSWSTRATAMTLGATIGGVAGNAVVKATGATQGQTLVVLNDRLQKISITQASINGEMLKEGDAVYIIRQSGSVRATRISPNDPLGAAFVAGLQGSKK